MTEPQGDAQAELLDDLEETLYDALREHAHRMLGHRVAPVQATDLVHDAYIRLARKETYQKMQRADFLALSATIVRRLLIDELRRGARLEVKADVDPTPRFGGGGLLALDDELNLLDLDAALQRLEIVDPRQSRVVELRFFGGLSAEEVARVLGVSRRTISKEWTLARAWLKRELE